MKLRSVNAYVIFVVALASGALFIPDWSVLQNFSAPSLLGFTALAALAFLSESLALSVTIAKSAGNSSIIFLPLFACQVLFGPAATTGLILCGYWPAEIFVRKKEALKSIFNVSQLIVAIVLGGVVYRLLGGVPLGFIQDGTARIASQLVPFAAYTVVFLGVNHLAVTWAIALDRKLSFRKVWRNRAGRSAANSFYDLLISPVAIGVAYLYLELGFIGIVIALLPLLFIRHAYLNTYKLQQANRDLLRALVKAIETRDPYTSGHSRRVSELARRIADSLGVSRRKVEAIETGALLHDIGKIEAIYTEILRKPGGLTEEERKIIESHVHKGAELLQSLSSFGDDVVEVVLHHHERVDGKGYPDGLSGETIPLGARIIKVCDAIDAMLSDRPYRDALTLGQVREQLLTYGGSQFDRDIVTLVVESDLLGEHKENVEVSKKRPDSEIRNTTSQGERARTESQLVANNQK